MPQVDRGMALVHSEGKKSGILSAGVLLAEIPPDPNGSLALSPMLLVSASVAATVTYQLRNAANNASIWEQDLFVNPTDQVEIMPPPSTIPLATNERLRVVLAASLIGTVQATLFV